MAERIVLSRDAYYYHPAEQASLPKDTANQAALERKRAAQMAKKLEQESNILSFNCHPNPVKDLLGIELTLRKAIGLETSLWDMNGRLIRRFPAKTGVTHYMESLDMRSLPSGYYLIEITAGNETVSEKIVVSN